MDHITLIGADDVRSAGIRMVDAAQDMKHAAGAMEDSFARQRQFMDEWLLRLEQMIHELAERGLLGGK